MQENKKALVKCRNTSRESFLYELFMGGYASQAKGDGRIEIIGGGEMRCVLFWSSIFRQYFFSSYWLLVK